MGADLSCANVPAANVRTIHSFVGQRLMQNTESGRSSMCDGGKVVCECTQNKTIE